MYNSLQRCSSFRRQAQQQQLDSRSQQTRERKAHRHLNEKCSRYQPGHDRVTYAQIERVRHPQRGPGIIVEPAGHGEIDPTEILDKHSYRDGIGPAIYFYTTKGSKTTSDISGEVLRGGLNTHMYREGPFYPGLDDVFEHHLSPGPELRHYKGQVPQAANGKMVDTVFATDNYQPTLSELTQGLTSQDEIHWTSCRADFSGTYPEKYTATVAGLVPADSYENAKNVYNQRLAGASAYNDPRIASQIAGTANSEFHDTVRKSVVAGGIQPEPEHGSDPVRHGNQSASGPGQPTMSAADREVLKDLQKRIDNLQMQDSEEKDLEAHVSSNPRNGSASKKPFENPTVPYEKLTGKQQSSWDYYKTKLDSELRYPSLADPLKVRVYEGFLNDLSRGEDP